MNNLQVLSLLQSTYGSANWNNWTVNRWDFYDYVRYPVGGTVSLAFFNIAQGGVDPNSSLAKSLEQCNVPKARSFGQVYFILQQIRVHASILPKARQHATIQADTAVTYQAMTNMMSKYLELTRRGVLNVQIGQKQYFDIEQPLTMAPPGFGIDIKQHASSYVSAAGLWTSDSVWVQQNPSSQNVYSLAIPQVIEPEQTVDVTIDYPSTSPVFTGLVDAVDPRIDIGVIFSGYIARPAQ